MLGPQDQITANATITIQWSGIIGPLTNASDVQTNIRNAFLAAGFVVTQVELPLLQILNALPNDPKTIIGYFQDVDGGGHSAIGRNLFESEVEQIFLNIMPNVPGVYNATVNAILGGQVDATLLPPGTAASLGMWGAAILAVLALIAIAIISHEV